MYSSSTAVLYPAFDLFCPWISWKSCFWWCEWGHAESLASLQCFVLFCAFASLLWLSVSCCSPPSSVLSQIYLIKCRNLHEHMTSPTYTMFSLKNKCIMFKIIFFTYKALNDILWHASESRQQLSAQVQRVWLLQQKSRGMRQYFPGDWFRFTSDVITPCAR